MTDANIRALTLGLLASTAFTLPAYAQTAAPAKTAAQSDNDSNDIVITATKREENLQDVPASIQAIGTKKLDQLNITNFEQYTKQLPSVSFQTAAPGYTVVYMRGVATGGDGNHSGSLPSVGSYLDEQPITTIGGTLDVHIYDIARIESLAGPQGTLYGASSEAGTIRIITNKPELGVTTGRIDAEVNKVAHGGVGGNMEGMINLPVTDNIAFRASGFWQRDAGYIDNVHGTRAYCGTKIVDGCLHDGFTLDNAQFVKKNFNVNTTWGGRAALKIDLDDNWTITPTIMHQESKTKGVWAYNEALGDLKTQRFMNEPGKDKFTQYALTVEGKLGDFDITYAGAYMHRPNSGINDYTDYTDAYDAYYESYGGLANYQYFYDNAGDPVSAQQYITGGNNFKKMSQELRIATPADKPFRVIAGAFYQRQSNDILQEYHVDNLADSLSVNGRPGLIWLTKQKRIDRDFALFGEASFDVTPQITLTAGGRYYKFNNTVFGFAGFGRDPAFFQGASGNPPPNAVGSTKTGVAQCFTTSGDSLRDSQLNGTDTTLIMTGALAGTPCINVGIFENGVVKPKQSKDDGFTYRFNATYKPTDDLLVYATWSKGFRPGGINRQPGLAPYSPDFLVNYELGVKATLGPVRWNTAVYRQTWKKFQFSFLGQNSLTEIQNGRDAKISGIETEFSYSRDGLSLNAAAAYTNAKTNGNICHATIDVDPTPDCSGLDSRGDDDFIVAPSGTRLPVTPKLKFSATARYAWDMGVGKAHVQAGLSHQTNAKSALKLEDQALTGTMPAYTLVDLYAGYDWSKYSIELFASNVFDERNQLSRGVACSICTNIRIVPGTPRTIGLRMGAKF